MSKPKLHVVTDDEPKPMRDYRSYLDDKGIQRGPWVTLADGRAAFERKNNE